VIYSYIYYYYFLINFFFHSHSLAYTGCIALKQRYVPYTNTNTLAMISTYGGVLSVIEKTLQELVEEYREVRRGTQPNWRELEL